MIIYAHFLTGCFAALSATKNVMYCQSVIALALIHPAHDPNLLIQPRLDVLHSYNSELNTQM